MKNTLLTAISLTLCINYTYANNDRSCAYGCGSNHADYRHADYNNDDCMDACDGHTNPHDNHPYSVTMLESLKSGEFDEDLYKQLKKHGEVKFSSYFVDFE